MARIYYAIFTPTGYQVPGTRSESRQALIYLAEQSGLVGYTIQRLA